MTRINVTFADYPMKPSRGPARLFTGQATVELGERLTLRDEKTGISLIPLQRRPKWRLWGAALDDEDRQADQRDLERFIVGRYGCLIDVLLYAAVMREAGVPSPNAYELKAQAMMAGDAQ